MGDSAAVSFEVKFLQLRDGDLQGFRDPRQTRHERLVRSAGDLFEEVSAEWISLAAYRAVGFSDKLRDNVEVLNLRKRLLQLAKQPVRIHLLQVGLRESALVFLIRGIRARENT